MNDTDTAPFEQSLTEGSQAVRPDLQTGLATAVPAGSAAEDQTRVEPKRTVPYGALAEERARRKELQRELQNAIEGQQRLQGRLDLLHELAQQHAASAKRGSGEASHERADGSSIEASQQVDPPVEESSQAQAAFRTQVMQSVRDVMRERPDFMAAYQHARQARVSELVALGYMPDEALGITFDNELEIIQNAYRDGRNPADVIYEYARRRGYGGGSPGARSDSTRRGVVGQRVLPTEAEKVALAARGQAASKSLSTAGGGSTGTLTLEALAGMSDEEFAEATKGDRWHKLLRG